MDSPAAAGRARVDARVMLYTIGLSYSAELLVKALYENTLGRVSEWVGGWHSADDRYAQQVQQRYGAFMHQTPWYAFPFWEALDGLWRIREPTNRLRHLNAHCAGAQDDQSTRHCLHAGRLAAGPDPFEIAQPRYRWDDRIGAVRQHDVLRRVANSVDFDDASAREPAVAAQQGYVYGDRPVMQLSMQCEIPFMRAWLVPLMPPGLQAALAARAQQ